ncbi:MAG TPA: COX aromatic rich motif-containing protein [Candidatus Saccharimonadales bacterium]|nr:COX aromatic rich motif-containing protein [Candidatus Saccharimonadales bacterium]
MAQRNKRTPSRVVLLLFLGLAAFGLILAMLLRGADFRLFNSSGAIAQEQLNLFLFSLTLLLIVAVPTVILLYFFAWKYRESNEKAEHTPNARHGGKLFVIAAWGIPTAFMLVLALVMWPATHKLEPIKPIDPGSKPLAIQVVAMRWKWLFIYPEQNIATVNLVQVPIGTQVEFTLTADEAPMSSFWIPHLGGQLYAMTGHANKLHLVADKPGNYPGSSAEINGAGFAGMKFTARASSAGDFNRWVQEVQQVGNPLDSPAYEKLVKPSENNQEAYYSMVEEGLYDKVLMKYTGGHNHTSQPATTHEGQE